MIKGNLYYGKFQTYMGGKELPPQTRGPHLSALQVSVAPTPPSWFHNQWQISRTSSAYSFQCVFLKQESPPPNTATMLLYISKSP